MRRAAERDLHTFGLHLVVVSVTFSAILVLLVGLTFLLPAVLGLDASQNLPRAMEAHARRILELHAVFWPVAAVCVVGVALSSWHLYRRMTGPFVRFRRAFLQLAQGVAPEPIELRNVDYLARDAKAINDMSAMLRMRMRALQEESSELMEILEALSMRPELSELSGPLQRGLEHAKRIEAEARAFMPHRPD